MRKAQIDQNTDSETECERNRLSDKCTGRPRGHK